MMMMLAFRAGIKSQLVDNSQDLFDAIIGRSIVSANVEEVGVSRCGIVSALTRRLHGHTILKFM